MRLGRIHLALLATLLLTAHAAWATENFSANLDGAQAGSNSTATGHGDFVLRTDGMLEFSIQVTGLLSPETARHIHGPAPRGKTAGILFALPTGNLTVGEVGPLTSMQMDELRSGLLYVNVHSLLYTSGEIRGQIEPSTVHNESSAWGRVKALYLER